jgi:hypothetical protein
MKPLLNSPYDDDDDDDDDDSCCGWGSLSTFGSNVNLTIKNKINVKIQLISNLLR